MGAGMSDHLYPNRRRVPLWLKVAYTVFMAVWVPSYWVAYGPTNFLYFCDIALFVTLIALWKESPLLASAPAVGILIPQTLWCLDFFCGLFGYFPVGMTDYMFDSKIDLYYRSLSFFHVWLPFLLVYLVARLGYDRRALRLWSVSAWSLLVICYFWMPPPPAPPQNPTLPVNINYVYGLREDAPQTYMPPNVWFALLMAGMPVLIFLPTHWILERWRGSRS